MSEDYLLNSKAIGINTSDIFTKQFDITWSNNVLNQKFFTKIPIEKIDDDKDDGSIIYQYNNEYFRCDDFIQNNNKMHILFAGCSQSEGVGGNIEDSWTNILYNKIKNNNDVDGFYSIARAGYGWQKIISNFLIYIEKYGKPDFLFILLPNVGRVYEWQVNENHWTYKQKYPYFFIENGKYKNEIGMSEKDYYETLINFKASWDLFEKFCKTNNIKLLWSTWDELDHQNFKTMGVSENYINLAINEKMELYFKEYIKNNKLKKDDMNRRDDHYGTLYNRYWADNFYRGIKERWEVK